MDEGVTLCVEGQGLSHCQHGMQAGLVACLAGLTTVSSGCLYGARVPGILACEDSPCDISPRQSAIFKCAVFRAW